MSTELTMNKPRSDLSGRGGAAVMFIFAGIAGYRFAVGFQIFFLLLILRDLAAAYFLFTRAPSVSGPGPLHERLLAYVSSALPLIYFSPIESTPAALLMGASLLSIIGFCVSTVALFEISHSFGVAPASRPTVKSGIYRFVRHPMYLGYVIAEVAILMVNPLNFLIFGASVSLYFWRGKIENSVHRLE